MSSVPAKWLGDEESKPAPEPLRRVQSLINTLDRESGLDRLAAAGDAAPWMTANELLAPGGTPTDDDLLTLIGVREGLRALVQQSTDGQAPDPALVSPLHQLAQSELVQAAVTDDGAVGLAPVGDSVRARLLTLLLIVSDAQRD